MDIDTDITDMLDHKYRYRIDIGKGDIDPPLPGNKLCCIFFYFCKSERPNDISERTHDDFGRRLIAFSRHIPVVVHLELPLHLSHTSITPVFN